MCLNCVCGTKLAKQWLEKEMIRPTFYLFAEEHLLCNYRGNIQVSSHVLPYDWRKHKNRTGWAYKLNHQHDLIDKTPCCCIHSYLYRENIWPHYHSRCCTHFMSWNTSQFSVESATKNAEDLQCFQKGTYRVMCGKVRLAERTPYKTTDMQTWLSFSQATHSFCQNT